MNENDPMEKIRPSGDEVLEMIFSHQRYCWKTDKDGNDRRADFSFMLLDKDNLADQDLYLYGAGFGNAELDGVCLTGSSLDFAYFKYADIKNAVFTDAKLDRADLSHSQWQKCVLSGVTFSGADITGALFEDVNLQKGCFYKNAGSYAMFYGCDLTGCEINMLDCSEGLTIRDGIMKDVKIEYSTIKPQWENLSFEGAALTGLTLTGGSLKNVSFKGAAEIEGLKLSEVELENVDFSGCLLKNCDFSKVDIENVNWTGAEFRNVLTRQGVHVSGPAVNYSFNSDGNW